MSSGSPTVAVPGRRGHSVAGKSTVRKNTISHHLKRLPTVGRSNTPNLKKLPYALKQAIRGKQMKRALNMDNVQHLMADQVASYVIGLANELPDERLGDFVSLVGVDEIPDLGHLISSKDGRMALARAFARKLDTPAKLKAFENASFALQADAYPNYDQEHPLCAMWNAGGLHAALYSGAKYDDAEVRRMWGIKGGQTRKLTRKRRGARQSKRRGRI